MKSNWNFLGFLKACVATAAIVAITLLIDDKPSVGQIAFAMAFLALWNGKEPNDEG